MTVKHVLLIITLILAMSAASLETAAAGAGDDDETWSASIPLDSPAPQHAEYLEKVRSAIKAKWSFPCVKNEQTRQCEYKTTELVAEFGIRKDGALAFVNVLKSSGFQIYDDYAVNAVKQAAPFPPIPDTLSAKNVPIRATFRYVVESSREKILKQGDNP